MYTNYHLVIGLIFLSSLVMSACGGGSSGVESSTNSTDRESIDDVSQPPNPPIDEVINLPPIARIDLIGDATSGATVIIDGSSSSDPDGDALSFLWTQTQGVTVSLADRSNPLLSFIAPSVEQPTLFSFQLTVQDGVLTDSASVDILISPIADTTPPSVVSRVPQPNQSDVATTTQINITIDEPLLETSIGSQSLLVSHNGTYLSGNVSYDSTSYSLIFTPANPLSENVVYTVTLSNSLQDLVGNNLQGESWGFTTGSQYNLGQTQQETMDLCMDDADKLMLTLVNNARGVARPCGTTDYEAVSPLSWHCSLEQAAQGHSTSMADNNFFSHTGLDGSNPGDRISATGYPWRAYGENIAAGYSTAEVAMNVWLNSPGHCANIMNSRFTEMGNALAENPTSQFRIYWTQNFADR